MIRTIFGTLLLLSLPLTAQAARFFTDFEDQDQRMVGSFTISNGGLSATFAGGTAFTIGNTELYYSGDVSWMIDPQGSSPRGESSGTGTIELSEPAGEVRGFLRTENDQASARLQLIDETGAVAREVTAGHADWTQFNHQVMSGEPLIVRLNFINDGGGMAALDDFAFLTDEDIGTGEDIYGGGPGGGSGGGSGSGSGGGGGSSGALGPFALLLALVLWRRRR